MPRFLLLLVTAIFQFSTVGCVHASDDLAVRMDTLIADTSVRPFNGVIVISQNGDTLYQKARGFADSETGRPLAISDRFRIQSNTKQITAVLVLREVERGSIDLRAPISTYLPDLRQQWADQVTTHHLLNMTSGITSLDEPLAFPPGSSFHYSNPAYGLLGQILEKVTGAPYPEIAGQLFAEMGMNDTAVFLPGMDDAFVSGHMGTPDAPKPIAFADFGFSAEGWKAFMPTGGVISTASDLLIWDTSLHGGELLAPESYDKLTEYSITRPDSAFAAAGAGYGYGVMIDDKSLFRSIGHAGRGMGFASMKFTIPEKDLTVVILENVYLSPENTEDPEVIYHFETAIKDAVTGWLAAEPTSATH